MSNETNSELTTGVLMAPETEEHDVFEVTVPEGKDVVVITVPENVEVQIQHTPKAEEKIPTALDGKITLGLVAALAIAVIAVIIRKLVSKGKAAPAAEVTVEEVEPTYAPGSAGQLKLHNVEPKNAAMLMAIVADKLGKPLNELRFISIKEVE